MTRPMVFVRAALVAAFLLAMASPVSSASAKRCEPREKIVSMLQDKWHERVVWTGFVLPQVFAELWVGPTGTWSWIVTYPNGMACAIAAGRNATFHGSGPKGNPA